MSYYIVYLLFSQKLSVSVSYKVVSYMRDSTVFFSFPVARQKVQEYCWMSFALGQHVLSNHTESFGLGLFWLLLIG